VRIFERFNCTAEQAKRLQCLAQLLDWYRRPGAVEAASRSLDLRLGKVKTFWSANVTDSLAVSVASVVKQRGLQPLRDSPRDRILVWLAGSAVLDLAEMFLDEKKDKDALDAPGRMQSMMHTL